MFLLATLGATVFALAHTGLQEASAAPTAEAFAAGLDAAHELVEDAEWSRARDELSALAALHAETPWALERRHELIRLLERATFWATHQRPTARDLFACEVLSWRERDGRIHLRYRDRSPEESDERITTGCVERRVFPVPFTGDLRIEVEGREPASGSRPEVWVGIHPDEPVAHRIEITSAGGRQTVRLWRCLGRGWTERVSAFETRSRSRFRLEIEVDGDTLEVALGGLDALSAGRVRGYSGYVAFDALEGCDRIEIEGRVAPAWMRQVLDARLQELWREFRRETRVERELPLPLRYRSLRRWSVPKLADDHRPGPQLPGQATIQADVLRAYALGGIDAALMELEDADLRDTSEVFRSWLRGWLHYADGDPEAALPHIEHVRREAPGDELAPVILALCLERVGRFDRALEIWRALLETRSERGWVLGRIARAESGLGRREAARATMQTALAEGLYGRDMDRVNATLVKSELGPHWEQGWAVDGDHYVVRTNIDRATATAAAHILEVALARFAGEHLPIRLERGRKFRAYLFDGRADYEAYMVDVLGWHMENTAGVFSPQLDQLLIWNMADRDLFLRTIRHEGFHQYLDLVAPEAPAWLNEGLAEYWETADFTKSRSRMVSPRPDLLGILARERIELPELVELDPVDFYARAPVSYASAWVQVYFLRHSTRENRVRFDALLERLAAGDAAPVAVREVLGTGDELRALDRECARFIEDL